jgi:hypothetical protein
MRCRAWLAGNDSLQIGEEPVDLRPVVAKLHATPTTQRQNPMSASSNTFLAVFLGSKTSPRMQAWMAMPEAERKAKEMEGFAGWKGWVDTHKDAIVYMGGPLGKTKAVGANGTEDVSNSMGAFMVLRADSHEAAAKLFENHPHFAIFPGEAVEVMPVLPIPQG